MKTRVSYIIALWIFLLAGCAALGLPKAQTFDQKLVVGYASVTAAVKTTTTLLEAKKISADDAQNVRNQAENVKQGLDIARALHKADPTAGDAKLTSAITALD